MRRIKRLTSAIFGGLLISCLFQFITINPSYSAVPTVTSVAPATGATSSSASVTITGENFEPGARVGLLNGGPFLAGAIVTKDRNNGASDVHVSGNYAYVADGWVGLLTVIDISNADAPTIVGSVAIRGFMEDVYVSGNYAYVIQNPRTSQLGVSSALAVVDISDPTAPVLMSKFDTPGSAQDVHVAGDYAYVVAKGEQPALRVIDISDPITPALVGSIPVAESVEDVYVSGDYAYVAEGESGLRIINIIDPTAPTLAGSIDTPGSAMGVHVSGNYAFVADEAAGLSVIDISDSASPFLACGFDVPGSARSVYISNDYAYIVSLGAGLFVIDISDPTAPEFTGTYSNISTRGESIYVAGDYAYMADSGEWVRGLSIIDISEPRTPALPVSVDTPDNAQDVCVAGDYGYVADGKTGSLVVDISNPELPALVGPLSTINADLDYYSYGKTSRVHVSDDYAYVTSNYLIGWDAFISELRIIDISYPASPTVVSFDINYFDRGYGPAFISSDVYVSGKYAYVTDGLAGLQVFDISDPTAPARVGSLSIDEAHSVYVSGKYAYMTTVKPYRTPEDFYRISNLLVIDISDPSSPTVVGSVSSSYDVINYWNKIVPDDVYVSGKYAYVANDELQVIDISDPAVPVFAGVYDTPGKAQGVYVSGKYAYVADGGAGLQVIDISDPTVPAIAGAYNTAGQALKVHIKDNYAYVANGGSGLSVVGINGPVADIVVVNSTTITATFPAGLPEGPYHIVVTNPGGQREEGYLYNAFNVGLSTEDRMACGNRTCDGKGQR